jgi:hypothetical protein
MGVNVGAALKRLRHASGAPDQSDIEPSKTATFTLEPECCHPCGARTLADILLVGEALDAKEEKGEPREGSQGDCHHLC